MSDAGPGSLRQAITDANGKSGVCINLSGNTIGATTPAARNVISGNAGFGTLKART